MACGPHDRAPAASTADWASARAARRSWATTGPRSPGWLYSPQTTTSTSQAAYAALIVSSFTPPSTPIGRSRLRRSACTQRAQLGEHVGKQYAAAWFFRIYWLSCVLLPIARSTLLLGKTRLRARLIQFRRFRSGTGPP